MLDYAIEILQKKLDHHNGWIKHCIDIEFPDYAKKEIEEATILKEAIETLKTADNQKCCGNCLQHSYSCKNKFRKTEGQEYCECWIFDNLTQSERLIDGK